MYKLVLTESERAAFNWIGGRYSNGAEMKAEIAPYPADPRDSWESVGPVAFDLPEHAAWTVAELAAEDDFRFPCFSEELTEKLQDFLDRIV